MNIKWPKTIFCTFLFIFMQGCVAAENKPVVQQASDSAGSSQVAALKGVWEGGGRANWNQGFTVENGKISFQNEECHNLNFSVIKKMDGNDAERKEASRSGSVKIIKYGYTTFYLEVELNDHCINKRYIMFTIPNYLKCSAYIDFYMDKETMFKVSPSWHANAVGRSFGKFPCD